jgi:hypothetical protein
MWKKLFAKAGRELLLTPAQMERQIQRVEVASIR